MLPQKRRSDGFIDMKEFFTLRNELSELRTLSEKLTELQARWVLPRKFLLEMNLVLDEYITNIIEHGTTGRDCTISVTINKSEDCITLEIVDDGPPFDPTTCPRPDTTLDLEERKCGGLGILLVDRFCDSSNYRRCNSHNIFVLKKYFTREDR